MTIPSFASLTGLNLLSSQMSTYVNRRAIVARILADQYVAIHKSAFTKLEDNRRVYMSIGNFIRSLDDVAFVVASALTRRAKVVVSDFFVPYGDGVDYGIYPVD
ncbi:hypothetical protein GCK32_006984 [Trichostrongylus colubriformis]|uniref:Uncharacterized protein n=1 Tax=Trichostrongylus colubriformis TaxID=6319 RepID=A0AAN8FME4_TRICO